jgi:DNA-binding transcriptional ArsR family regulator
MENAAWRDDAGRVAGRFAAMGSATRLRIMRLLLSAHPGGMVVGELQAELGLSGPNHSHHLENLRNQGLVNVAREGTFLRYSADAGALRELLSFLYAECCTRAKVVRPGRILRCG